MIKKLLLILTVFQISTCCAQCVCPVNTVLPLNTIEKQIKEQFRQSKENVYLGTTPTGFIISVRDELIFDECGELNNSGKIFLNTIAEIMKSSGRKWLILCHTTDGTTQLERISKTSLQAGTITNYLTDKEQCLINQIFPIGFGSIMSYSEKNTKFFSGRNHIDFIVETP